MYNDEQSTVTLGRGNPEQVALTTTYVLIDGENLDTTLGSSILGRRPAPEERPRWEKVLRFAEAHWGQPVKVLFFLNASSGTLPLPFIQALVAIGIQPIPLSGPADVKVVDVGIQRMFEAIAGHSGDVILGSHDGDFLPQVTDLLERDRQVGVLAFREFLNVGYLDLVERGLEILDLESDARCFNSVLPRLRIIDLATFDATAFL